MSSAPGTLTWSDEEVIARVKEGSVEAFGLLYDRFCARAWRVARSVCGDNGRSEEAVQEAFLSVWRNRARYDPQRGGASSWLMTIVRHQAIDAARREGRHGSQRADEELLATRAATDTGAADMVADDEARDLRAVLTRLPEAQREVITLAYFGQLSHSEIAEHLGLPAGTVKGRMRLGLEKLRGEVDQAGSGDG